jgi:hypothetical protein
MSPEPFSTIVSFPNWKQALATSALPSAQRESYRRAILGFLKFCKGRRAPAAVEVFRLYLGQVPGHRAALTWFFKNAPKAETDGVRGRDVVQAVDGGSGREAELVPPGAMPAGGSVAKWDMPDGGAGPARYRRDRGPPAPAAMDLGEVEWERDLIKAVREAGLLWRTEETYRAWAWRFARFLAPRSPYAATGQDIGGFLSELAVEGRVAPSTQRQALNALVFLMR